MNEQILTPFQWDQLSRRITSHTVGGILTTDKLPGTHIDDRTRSYVFDRDRHRCVYCKADTYLQCDHVIPLAHGGPGIKENVVLACESCNTIKSNSFRIDFLTTAFNHLLYCGENIDWIDKIFSVDIEEEYECLMCQEVFLSTIQDDFCSDQCEFDFDDEFEGED